MKKEKRSLWERIKAILIAGVLAGVIREFFFAPILVDGVSMASTLHDRDRRIVNEFGYPIGEPRRFVIIECRPMEEQD
uniref:S26 family signal peptidase n=1 Tax=Bacillus sp. S1-R5C1-FB TaxID=1973491 RepID=UPI001C4F78DC